MDTDRDRDGNVLGYGLGHVHRRRQRQPPSCPTTNPDLAPTVHPRVAMETVEMSTGAPTMTELLWCNELAVVSTVVSCRVTCLDGGR